MLGPPPRVGPHSKAATLSTESIASSSFSPSTEAAERCATCGSPLAPDQRYCLQCGERRVELSDFLRSGAPTDARASSSPAPPGSVPPTPPSDGGAPQRNNTLALIAGIGVLLLAMGVGVLIGRAGAPKQNAGPAQVITVGSAAPGSGSGSGSGGEESFTDDWPSATKGYTVQLESLPQEGTSAAAVEQAKTAAGSKGAASVGALKSEDFSSLTTGSYIVYSGVYHKRSEAQKALGSLKQKFPSAKVIEVSEGSASGGHSGAAGSSRGSSGGAGSSVTHPAPPSVLESLNKSKGKSYEEKSKSLPDVVSTG